LTKWLILVIVRKKPEIFMQTNNSVVAQGENFLIVNHSSRGFSRLRLYVANFNKSSPIAVLARQFVSADDTVKDADIHIHRRHDPATSLLLTLSPDIPITTHISMLEELCPAEQAFFEAHSIGRQFHSLDFKSLSFDHLVRMNLISSEMLGAVRGFRKLFITDDGGQRAGCETILKSSIPIQRTLLSNSWVSLSHRL
jgi:hypothetical protein